LHTPASPKQAED